MINQSTIDPLDAAMNPTIGEQNNEFWGQVQLTAWSCSLIKGQGKVPYNSEVHDRAWTAIDLVILPITEQNITNPRITERNLIAESKEWINITLASLRELGVTDLRQVIDRWAHVVVVDTGETYEKNGQIRHKTQFRFVELFEHEQQCKEDFIKKSWKKVEPETENQTPVDSSMEQGNVSSERDTAFAFARVIVENACKGHTDFDVVRNNLTQKLAMHPMISKYFTADTPEIVQLAMEHLK